MQRLRWLTLVWPGLPQLWFAGSGAGLALAAGDAGGLSPARARVGRASREPLVASHPATLPTLDRRNLRRAQSTLGRTTRPSSTEA